MGEKPWRMRKREEDSETGASTGHLRKKKTQDSDREATGEKTRQQKNGRHNMREKKETKNHSKTLTFWKDSCFFSSCLVLFQLSRAFEEDSWKLHSPPCHTTANLTIELSTSQFIPLLWDLFFFFPARINTVCPRERLQMQQSKAECGFVSGGLFVCLSVRRITQNRQGPVFMNPRWKGGARAADELITFMRGSEL